MSGKSIPVRLQNGPREVVYGAPGQLVPGCAAARAKGCSCPAIQPWDPNEVELSADCPLHPVPRRPAGVGNAGG